MLLRFLTRKFQQGNRTNIEHKLLLNSFHTVLVLVFVKDLMKHKFKGIKLENFTTSMMKHKSALFQRLKYAELADFCQAMHLELDISGNYVSKQ